MLNPTDIHSQPRAPRRGGGQPGTCPRIAFRARLYVRLAMWLIAGANRLTLRASELISPKLPDQPLGDRPALQLVTLDEERARLKLKPLPANVVRLHADRHNVGYPTRAPGNDDSITGGVA